MIDDAGERAGTQDPSAATGADGGGAPDDAWVVVAAGASPGPGEIVEATLGGADVVVWRTASGVPCVMEARCPHQWSHLGSTGAVHGEEIVCATHFWIFGTDGRGWKENHDGRRNRKGDIEIYPCREVAGEIRVRPPTPGGAS